MLNDNYIGADQAERLREAGQSTPKCPPPFLTKWSMVYHSTWRTIRDKVWKKTVAVKTSPFSISGICIPLLFLHKSN